MGWTIKWCRISSINSISIFWPTLHLPSLKLTAKTPENQKTMGFLASFQGPYLLLRESKSSQTFGRMIFEGDCEVNLSLFWGGLFLKPPLGGSNAWRFPPVNLVMFVQGTWTSQTLTFYAKIFQIILKLKASQPTPSLKYHAPEITGLMMQGLLTISFPFPLNCPDLFVI